MVTHSPGERRGSCRLRGAALRIPARSGSWPVARGFLDGRRVVTDVQRLLDVMARLRDPDGGCPWDVEQDFASIAPYTVEEAYEVEDAIRRGDPRALCDELGDLLFCCVNLARKLNVDPETALRGGNAKFERRFRRMEALMAADGLGFNDMPVDDVLEKYWTQAKREEK